MVRDENTSQILRTYMLSNSEDGDIITQFLQRIKTWCHYSQNFRYIIIDDSAAKQKAVKLAFPSLIVGKMEVSHFLYRTHLEQIMKKTLARDTYREARRHLYGTLYYQKTSMECEKSINLAIQVAPTNKKIYLKREWLNNKHLWANYVRQHSCLLLQNMTTNIVESWY